VRAIATPCVADASVPNRTVLAAFAEVDVALKTAQAVQRIFSNEVQKMPSQRKNIRNLTEILQDSLYFLQGSYICNSINLHTLDILQLVLPAAEGKLLNFR
jgi:uncharacterized membrane protein